VKLALLCLWELPQNVAGLVWLGIARVTGSVRGIAWDRGRLMIENRHVGVSLGLFVFWFGDAKTRDHEWGHGLQSQLLGPLYLLVVGLPSVLRVLYARLFRAATGRGWTRYYDGFPEDWADRLGGVARPR
jgi:hypothetical protein